MNRYVDWWVWRIQGYWRAGLSSRLALLAVFGLFILFHSAVLGLSSPRFMAVASHMVASSVSGNTERVGGSIKSVPDDGVHSAPVALSDPLATADIEDVRRALSDLSARPDWLSKLENVKMVRSGTRVHIRSTSVFSERQLRLLNTQGFNLVSWSSPGARDELTPSPEFWVEQESPGRWKILSRPMDVSGRDLDSPPELVVLRAILWIESLDALERWRQSHPAPEPPADLLPGGVEVSLLSSTASNQMMALTCAWIGILLTMAVVSMIQISFQARRHAGGWWSPLACLNHETSKWLVVRGLSVAIPLFTLSLLAGLLSFVVLHWVGGFDVNPIWCIRLPLWILGFSLLSHAICSALGTFQSAWPKIFSAIWLIGLLVFMIWISDNGLGLRHWSPFFTLFWGGLPLVFSLGASFLFIFMGARKLDGQARAGYQNIG